MLLFFFTVGHNLSYLSLSVCFVVLGIVFLRIFALTQNVRT